MSAPKTIGLDVCLFIYMFHRLLLLLVMVGPMNGCLSLENFSYLVKSSWLAQRPISTNERTDERMHERMIECDSSSQYIYSH